jgi:hypothetical protein
MHSAPSDGMVYINRASLWAATATAFGFSMREHMRRRFCNREAPSADWLVRSAAAVYGLFLPSNRQRIHIDLPAQYPLLWRFELFAHIVKRGQPLR